MSCNNDLIAIPPRKQHRLLDPSCSSQRAGPSTRTRHLGIRSSTSLPLNNYPSQVDLDSLLDPLDDIVLDSDLDQRTASSTTLLSHRSDLSHRLSESRRPGFLYPLHEPGQMTAQRIQRLRARTAAVIMSLPVTSEKATDTEQREPCEVAAASPVAQAPKLRRVSGIRDLRRAFRDGNHKPVHFASTSSLGASKASYELGILTDQTPPSSALSAHSSLRTLVELGNGLPHSSGDLKTLCGSTFSSISIASRLTMTKVHSTLPLSRPSYLPTDTSQSMSPKKYLVPNPFTPRPQRHTSLRLDIPPSRSPGEKVWSCAKISQSTLKRAARRGHPPRRVFSNPIATLSP